MIDCVGKLNFGQLFSFFSGRSKLANIIKSIINYPNSSPRPKALFFSPTTYLDKVIYLNPISNEEEYSIGTISESIDINKYYQMKSIINNNSNMCNECNINHFCPNFPIRNNMFIESEIYYIFPYSCQIVRKMVELSFVFFHKSKTINFDALKYSCAINW